MDYKDKYIKYKTKYLELKNVDINNQIGGYKDIVFLFFNGGGLNEKQWVEHPYKEQFNWLNRDNEKSNTDLIDKIKTIGDVYLHTPKFYLTDNDIKNGKRFTTNDLNLIKYSKNVYKNIKKYKKIFIISHSRGYISAKFFCQLYSNKIIGYINIDGGESDEWKEKKLNEWSKKYDYINNTELKKLFDTSNNENKNADIISRFVKYKMYEQDYKNKYNFNNISMLIINNIYNDSETSVKNIDYVNETLISKFNFNKNFENNNNIRSIYYVGKTHYLYLYDDVKNDILDYISKILQNNS
jgi:hypothetical protein